MVFAQSNSFKKMLFFFLFGLGLALPFQGTRPFLGRDEHRYPQIAASMLKSGDFLKPKFKGHLHLTKPPFTYWALAISIKVFGFTPWGARIPNALAFAATVSLIFLLGQELFDQGIGERAAFLYGGTLLPFAAANVVTTDTLLVLWETLAVFFLVKGLKGQKRAFLFMWFSWGLAFLTKGTACLPVAAAAFLFWCFERKRFPSPFSLTGLVVFSLVAFPWYVYLCLKVPEALKIFWVEQVYGRLFSNMFHRNSTWYAPFYLYLPLLTLGALPGFGFWIKNKEFFGFKRTRKIWSAEWRFRLLVFLYIGPLIVFCLAKSRLPLYILPLFVPFTLLSARIFSFSLRKLLWWFPLIISLKALISYHFR